MMSWSGNKNGNSPLKGKKGHSRQRAKTVQRHKEMAEAISCNVLLSVAGVYSR